MKKMVQEISNNNRWSQRADNGYTSHPKRQNPMSPTEEFNAIVAYRDGEEPKKPQKKEKKEKNKGNKGKRRRP